VTTWQKRKMCLSCKYYRLRDEISGFCRVNKKKSTEYPVMKNDDVCEKWYDCGQHYYIRNGWIKGQKKKN